MKLYNWSYLTILVGFGLVFVLVSTFGCAGKQGNAGDRGLSGPAGSPGASGPQGLVGAPGQDASLVTLIKLCPGTPSHTVFVEYAVCLQGQLYGVYSANGGFLTLLSPGDYTSAGIGADCSLTVSANCVVSH